MEWIETGVSASRATNTQERGNVQEISCVARKSRWQSLEEERRGRESKLLEVQCELSTASDDLGCHACFGPPCFVKSRVNADNYQEMSNHFMILSAGQLYGDVIFSFEQDFAPAHSGKTTCNWFADNGITAL